MVKAEAACITCPSVMLPSRNFGAHNNSGTTGTMRFDPCDTSVVRMCWPGRPAPICRRTFMNALSMPRLLDLGEQVMVDNGRLLLAEVGHGDIAEVLVEYESIM